MTKRVYVTISCPSPTAVAGYAKVCLGQGLERVAVLDISEAMSRMRPGTIALGAVLMAIVCTGASLTRLLALHGAVVHTMIPELIVAVIAWSYRAQLLAVR